MDPYTMIIFVKKAPTRSKAPTTIVQLATRDARPPALAFNSVLQGPPTACLDEVDLIRTLEWSSYIHSSMTGRMHTAMSYPDRGARVKGHRVVWPWEWNDNAYRTIHTYKPWRRFTWDPMDAVELHGWGYLLSSLIQH